MKAKSRYTSAAANETQGLQDKLSRLSTLIYKALTRLLRSMEKGGLKEVISGTEERKRIKGLENEIEEHCIRILVQEKGQPRFLRWAARAMIIVTLIEGAYQQIIMAMESISVLTRKRRTSLHNDAISMARLSRGMLRESIHAFLTMDEHLARKVLQENAGLDQRKEAFFDQAFGFMIDHPESLRETMRWLLISKRLERIGDHAGRIAEEVIFLARE